MGTVSWPARTRVRSPRERVRKRVARPSRGRRPVHIADVRLYHRKAGFRVCACARAAFTFATGSVSLSEHGSTIAPSATRGIWPSATRGLPIWWNASGPASATCSASAPGLKTRPPRGNRFAMRGSSGLAIRGACGLPIRGARGLPRPACPERSRGGAQSKGDPGFISPWQESRTSRRSGVADSARSENGQRGIWRETGRAAGGTHREDDDV